MSVYTIALFLHVSGAIGAFVSVGIWLFGLSTLRRSQRVEQVRAIAWLIVIASPLMVFSVLLIIIAGLDMALSTWGLGTGWIAVALVSFVLIGPVGAFALDPRMRAIMAIAREEPDGLLSDTLDRRIHDPVLGTGVQTLAAALLGIVFLMTTKPSLAISIVVMVVALALGLASGLPLWYAARIRARRASARVKSHADVDPFQRKTIWTRRW
ncbi:MAG TPA: DUF2269 family protein [Ktedonobacteraceae bacterium]|nr:DUF2269 family protein [Ktedonobacteraceae bacterium]